MLLLIDSVDHLPPSASKRDIEASTQAAQWAGFECHHIEPDFTRCGDAEGALWRLQDGPKRKTFWLGYIPSRERYSDIFEACARRGLHLPNNPEEHTRAMEFDLAYPRLEEFTARTEMVTTLDEARATKLQFPIFIKGSVQSLKADGWKACVAQNPAELESLVTRLLKLQARARGKVILRELLDLRHARVSGLGFPIGREYRAFIYKSELINLAYYWDCEDEVGTLTDSEKQQIVTLAIEAANRLEVPYCSIDIGQTTDLKWWVIESADAQFSGIRPDSVTRHWHTLNQAAKCD